MKTTLNLLAIVFLGVGLLSAAFSSGPNEARATAASADEMVATARFADLSSGACPYLAALAKARSGGECPAQKAAPQCPAMKNAQNKPTCPGQQTKPACPGQEKPQKADETKQIDYRKVA